MPKSIKAKNNTYLDTKGIVHKRQILSDKLLLPYILYDNDSGTTGNITLNDSLANYTYIEIFWHSMYNNNQYSNKIYKPNGKKTTLFYVEGADTTKNNKVDESFLFWSGISFSDKNITRNSVNHGLTSLSGSYSENVDRIIITRVIGYK